MLYREGERRSREKPDELEGPQSMRAGLWVALVGSTIAFQRLLGERAYSEGVLFPFEALRHALEDLDVGGAAELFLPGEANTARKKPKPRKRQKERDLHRQMQLAEAHVIADLLHSRGGCQKKIADAFMAEVTGEALRETKTPKKTETTPFRQFRENLLRPGRKSPRSFRAKSMYEALLRQWTEELGPASAAGDETVRQAAARATLWNVVQSRFPKLDDQAMGLWWGKLNRQQRRSI